MDVIIRGTTPTIMYKFHTVDPNEISVAYLTACDENTVIVERDLTTATVGSGYISWTLTQEESLRLPPVTKWMCNWKKSDGTRGASTEMHTKVVRNQKNEVI